MSAAKHDQLDAVKELLKAGAERQAQDIGRRHVLHHAGICKSSKRFFLPPI